MELVSQPIWPNRVKCLLYVECEKDGCLLLVDAMVEFCDERCEKLFGRSVASVGELGMVEERT